LLLILENRDKGHVDEPQFVSKQKKASFMFIVKALKGSVAAMPVL
jgi:hypothetical protein